MDAMLFTHISFPHIRLQTRDGHKLRGYFGQLFRVHSPLHNHYDDGSLRYGYPLVQYKVVGGVPTLVGLGEGSRLLTELFLRIQSLDIEGRVYPVDHKYIRNERIAPAIVADMRAYVFATPWMALNQRNYAAYRRLDEGQQQPFLQRVLRNHLVAVLRTLGAALDVPLLVAAQVQEHRTRFKDQEMSTFAGTFVCNADLPDDIGIGKSVSRGFGTIQRR
ncbi:MAG: hypothetical protein OHK0039_41340 [Bacteroidia bacterium]